MTYRVVSDIGLQVDIAIPEDFVCGLLGAMLIFVLSGWACSVVGRTAQKVVTEVRRQFLKRPGIMVSACSQEFHQCRERNTPSWFIACDVHPEIFLFSLSGCLFV
jgi:Na+/H+-translocating membrane pyrophosphatase